MTSGVVKIRDAAMELAVPSFQPTVHEAPSNIYIQNIEAQSSSADRISWNFRAPSSSLLCSPYVEGIMRLKIRSAQRLDKLEGVGPLLGCYQTGHAA